MVGAVEQGDLTDNYFSNEARRVAHDGREPILTEICGH